MKIGLIDVDGHNFPNLALMKISALHKCAGNDVEMWNGLKQYDVVYKAKVFDDSFTEDEQHCIMADQIISGGTGYGLDNKLPDEVEHQYPDYGLYNTKKAYGFLTRGCPRNCKFCIVSQKEGRKSEKVADLKEFWTDQKEIVLMDSNITASKDCNKLFSQLIESKAKINFEGGLDIRLMDDKKVDQLNQMRIEIIHFAWDNYEFKTYEKLKYFRPMFRYRSRDLSVYVLTNHNTTHEQDLERIYKLKELGYDPYVTIFDKPNAPRETRLVQRWVNNRPIFQSCERFEDYDPRRG